MVPPKTMLLRSPRARSSPRSGSVFLCTGTDSPVSAASSTCKIDRLDQSCVGRHLVARVQQNEVAWHEPARRNLDLLAVADHRYGGRGHSPERFERAFRSVLLYEAQHYSEQHDHGDGDRLDAVSEKGGDRRSDQQDDDQDILELPEQNGPGRDTISGLQLVRSVESKSTFDFGLRQAVRVRAQSRQDAVNGQRMPRRRNCVRCFVDHCLISRRRGDSLQSSGRWAREIVEGSSMMTVRPARTIAPQSPRTFCAPSPQGPCRGTTWSVDFPNS